MTLLTVVGSIAILLASVYVGAFVWLMWIILDEED